MELFFNFTWALVAIASVCFWALHGGCKSECKRASAIGLALLVVILFPVISVSDDLWSLQNPTETDSCQRRDYASCTHHWHPIAVSGEPENVDYELRFESRTEVAIGSTVSRAVDNPALGSIENRPPPAL